ncbi:hypothetical protein DEU38_11143 [Rhodococcus sp. AG1013]|nr:hypothetical protein DEU38_11143 [Rhodococcus sp. AG1013]
MMVLTRSMTALSVEKEPMFSPLSELVDVARRHWV